MLRKLAFILVLEALVAANAGLSFRLFERFAAGIWAGACFVFLGLYILHFFYRWDFRSKVPLFWVAVAHTFAFAIPMLAARLVTPADENVAKVLFIPIEIFHKASTWCFALLMGATVAEIVRELLRMKKKKPTI